MLCATTDYVAFLDDDDVWQSQHIEVLLRAAAANPFADVIYTGCVVLDGAGREIPLQEDWGRFGQAFDGPLLLDHSYIPVTSLVRTEVAQRGRFATTPDTNYDDWEFYKSLYLQNAEFLHVPQITWIWNHWGGNTSGQGDRW